MRELVFGFMFFLAFAGRTADVVLIQTGKSFVQGIDETKAAAIAEDHDEVKKYTVPALKIKTGDVIHFNNVDSVKHNVMLEDHFNFIQEPGSRESYQFQKAGEYDVRCAIHPKMKIKVTVE